MRKVKQIGTNPTTRFEDIELNCGLGWSKTIKDSKSIACGGNACGVSPYSDSKVTNFEFCNAYFEKGKIDRA